MTKRELHLSLRKLKGELKYIKNYGEYVSIALKGTHITAELYNKGVSFTDLKLILSWETEKDKVRSQILTNGAA